MMTVQIIVDIIKTVLGLDDDRVWVWNQREEIPPDKGLFVSVGMMSIQPFGSNSTPVSVDGGGLQEHLSQQMQETISVQAFSYDTSAILRYPEIVGAMRSTYSQTQQEKYQFRIGHVPASMNDASFAEGAGILYRFDMTFRVLRSYGTINNIDYYNTHSTTVTPDEVHK